jgi:Ca2+-binding EF-hand superfamily protein
MSIGERRFNELFRLIDINRNGAIELWELTDYINLYSDIKLSEAEV